VQVVLGVALLASAWTTHRWLKRLTDSQWLWPPTDEADDVNDDDDDDGPASPSLPVRRAVERLTAELVHLVADHYGRFTGHHQLPDEVGLMKQKKKNNL